VHVRCEEPIASQVVKVRAETLLPALSPLSFLLCELCSPCLQALIPLIGLCIRPALGCRASILKFGETAHQQTGSDPFAHNGESQPVPNLAVGQRPVRLAQ